MISEKRNCEHPGIRIPVAVLYSALTLLLGFLIGWNVRLETKVGALELSMTRTTATVERVIALAEETQRQILIQSQQIAILQQTASRNVALIDATMINVERSQREILDLLKTHSQKIEKSSVGQE